MLDCLSKQFVADEYRILSNTPLNITNTDAFIKLHTLRKDLLGVIAHRVLRLHLHIYFIVNNIIIKENKSDKINVKNVL